MWYRFLRLVMAGSPQDVLRSWGTPEDVISWVMVQPNAQWYINAIGMKRRSNPSYTPTINELAANVQPERVDTYSPRERLLVNRYNSDKIFNDWVHKAIHKSRVKKEKGGDWSYTTPPEEMVYQIHRIYDWYNSAKPQIASYTFEQAAALANEYFGESSSGKTYYKTQSENIVFGPTWAGHPEWDGWTIQNITEPNDLVCEGRQMNHCVHGHGYINKIRTGQGRIFSLRDPKNHPVVTVEVDGQEYKIIQLKGNSNKAPTEYKEMLGLWFGSVGARWKNAGAYKQTPTTLEQFNRQFDKDNDIFEERDEYNLLKGVSSIGSVNGGSTNTISASGVLYLLRNAPDDINGAKIAAQNMAELAVEKDIKQLQERPNHLMMISDFNSYVKGLLKEATSNLATFRMNMNSNPSSWSDSSSEYVFLLNIENNVNKLTSPGSEWDTLVQRIFVHEEPVYKPTNPENVLITYTDENVNPRYSKIQGFTVQKVTDLNDIKAETLLSKDQAPYSAKDKILNGTSQLLSVRDADNYPYGFMIYHLDNLGRIVVDNLETNSIPQKAKPGWSLDRRESNGKFNTAIHGFMKEHETAYFNPQSHKNLWDTLDDEEERGDDGEGDHDRSISEIVARISEDIGSEQSLNLPAVDIEYAYPAIVRALDRWHNLSYHDEQDTVQTLCDNAAFNDDWYRDAMKLHGLSVIPEESGVLKLLQIANAHLNNGSRTEQGFATLVLKYLPASIAKVKDPPDFWPKELINVV